MKTVRHHQLLILLALLGLKSHCQKPATENRCNFKKYYEQFNVKGSFVLYDQNNNKFIFYHRNQFRESFSPASTFKICNSLIGLETGVIEDENFIIPWDSVVRPNQKWNQDHDMKMAFKNSTVWYYQELARRVGGERMKYWLDKAQYGNADTSGGVDQFWLKGGLRVTPEEQIDFLRCLHNDELPFSKRSMDIMKHMMIAKDTLDYVVRAKTGWSDEQERFVGWYVGYVEKDNNVYYFANCIQTTDLDNEDFARARIEIVYAILRDLKVTEK